MSNMCFDEHGRVAFEGKMIFDFQTFPSMISADDCNNDELLEDMKTAMTAREAGGDQYSSGETFFMPAVLEPRCGLEKLALDIFKHHAKDAKFDPGRSGAEWWTQVIDTSELDGWSCDDSEANHVRIIHVL